MKTLVQKFLSARPHDTGETVQFGWFIFKIAEAGKPPRLESLDFQKVASFTEDFSEAERIRGLQAGVLESLEAVASPCNLQQFALVSKSYEPGREDVFIERQEASDGGDSGWYVGVLEEPRDMDDIESFVHRSLYELTIEDRRMAPYWLLPPGSLVTLAEGEIRFAQP